MNKQGLLNVGNLNVKRIKKIPRWSVRVLFLGSLGWTGSVIEIIGRLDLDRLSAIQDFAADVRHLADKNDPTFLASNVCDGGGCITQR